MTSVSNSEQNFKTRVLGVTEADLLRRLTLVFNELNFNTSAQNKK